MITLVDSYSEINYSGVAYIGRGVSYASGAAQSFTGLSGYLTNAKFWLKNQGSPTGNITAKLYSYSGTFGISSIPSGGALATSTAVDITTLPTAFELITFDFDGTYELIEGTNYFISVEYSTGDPANCLQMGVDATSPTHAGNAAYYISSWAVSASDLIFYIYANEITPPVASTTFPEVLSVAKVKSLSVTKEINGNWSADMTILPDDFIDTDSYVDVDSEAYIVKTIKKIKSNQHYYDVSLSHNAIEELTNTSIERFYLTKSVSDILDVILSGTDWIAGTVDIDEIVLVSTDRRTSVLEALNILADKCSGELYFHSKTRVVDLKNQIGTITGLHLRCDKNCDYIERESDSSDLVTRIFPYGSDNYTLNTTVLEDGEDETLYTASGAGTKAASSIKQFGSQAIQLNFAALNETMIRDLGAGGVKDLTGHTTVKFWIFSETDNASGVTFGIGESAYTDNTVNSGALTGGCWKEVTLNISAVAAASKNAIRYIGFKNLTSGAASVIFDSVRAFSGNIYIDSANINLYRDPKEFAYFHSSKVEKVQFEKLIYTSDDAYVHEASKNTNYGSKIYLEARNFGSYDFLSFMKFDLSPIPTGATLVAATLGVQCYWIKAGGVSVAVSECATDWNESTITYNNKPAAGTSVGSIDMTSTGAKTLDITSYVSDWYNAITDNFGLRFEVSSSADKISAWYSKENQVYMPYINVTYTLDSDPAPVILAAATQYLLDHEEPKLKYKVKMCDLSKVMIDTWEDETIDIGDTVKIYDSDLNLNVLVRVKKITKDLINPDNMTIELVNKAYSIADIEAQRAKQLAYAMPFTDNPRIISANAIQAGYFGGDVNV